MTWQNQPATESQPGHPGEFGHEPHDPPIQGASSAPVPGATGSGKAPEIRIGKAVVLAEENGKEVEATVFTMTLGTETIELLPLKNWGQLDVYKWKARGKLPDTPAGLEIAFDHLRLAGETVSAKDPEGCAKLQKLFDDWLALEKETLALARKKAQPKPALAAAPAATASEPQAVRFHVERDKGGQVHIRCTQGKEELAAIGLNLPGFAGLFRQGLMRKPHVLQVGAMHDWVELDGVPFSFEKGNNDAAKLEQLLNGRYVPEALGRGKEVVLFANPASSTGFDIQFPVSVGGVRDNHRRALNEEALELLQDPNACGLLQKGLLIKLARPNLIFKQKTPDGGERYLAKSAENVVTVIDDDGAERAFDLSQPVSYMRLSAVELTAVFNHPSINKHGKIAPPANEPAGERPPPAAPPPAAAPPPPAASPPAPRPPPPAPPAQPVEGMGAGVKGSPPESATASAAEKAAEAIPEPIVAVASVEPAPEVKPLPNAWLKEPLARPPIRHDWFVCLTYSRMAERFGNSSEGKFGLSACWAIALGETEEIADPAFKGVFLTEKRGLGFVNQGRLARFSNGVAFIGTQESALEGIGVGLVGVGMDVEQRIVFIVTDNYFAKFGVPDQTLRDELGRLRASGALVLSVKEALESRERLEVVWTVPAEQANPDELQALESTPPAEGAPRPDPA